MGHKGRKKFGDGKEIERKKKVRVDGERDREKGKGTEGEIKR